MQNYDYFDSFFIHSFNKPIKGIEEIMKDTLFILLDDGTCIVFCISKMKIINEQKFAELQHATHCTKFSIQNGQDNQIRDLIMTQHKLGFLGILMVEDNTHNIVFLQKIQLEYTGFMKILPNEEIFSYKTGYSQQRSVLINECFLYSPNKKDTSIEKLNLLNGKPVVSYQFYEEKYIDTICCMKKVAIENQESIQNLLIVAYEGLYMGILELDEKNQKHKFLLQRTKIVDCKEEMPYIFDFQLSVNVKEPKNDIVITIYICTSVEELQVLKLNLTDKKITSQSNINIKYLSPQIGLSNIKMDKKQLYVSTLDRQVKILSRKKLQEVCSFQFHNNSINGLLLITDQNLDENGQQKSKFLISISEDCKMAVIDLNKLRKKK
ncbi:hypothetical protein TTHERM_00444230 (macronuclear) [Tetrahymena thermophila SB210]|uniref:Uncharacterized protein n=1 Tax=Tetrahymena thermophila (strain SB210) TaxID=312017 RepID=I7M3F4_TETTS|nr:hypothetical protein TTHERM_00444230 [Tetrahymena thermophila SB210]EAS03040.2 hypothetical protein TTHERM_00444230 [Tetrahymena thermophila SB210]|eukprot:XP_001023285.2 hypothetical protein TTHERM_00444230 [Tetrahymena thermophila SB210]